MPHAPRLEPKGLATLALLKARYDEKRDHLSLFEPFVEDALASLPADGFGTLEVCKTVQARHGIVIPTETAKTLLDRLVKRGLAKREGGRFFPGSKIPQELHIDEERAAIQANIDSLSRKLLGHARASGTPFASVSAARDALLAFLDRFNAPLLLNDMPSAAPETAETTESRATADFLRNHAIQDPESRAQLQQVLEGVLLSNLLFLRNVTNAEEKFGNVIVLLDTAILFNALGVAGSAAEHAAMESIQVLRMAGLTLQVLDRTVVEMRRILAVYEGHLGTPEGQLALFPTDLTRFFITNRWRPSDVKQLDADLERRLGALNLPVRRRPDRIPRLTLDEEALALVLQNRNRPKSEPRIVHDIDCVATVLILRDGNAAATVEHCRAVFTSTTSMVVRQVQKWHADQGQTGMPPIIHFAALTNIAWLKVPRASSSAALADLVSLCAVVLRPSRETWNRFLAHLKDLRDKNEITTDEAVAIVASEMVEPLLARTEHGFDTDSASVDEVIQRVITNYRAQAAEESRATIEDLEKRLADAELRTRNETSGKVTLSSHVERLIEQSATRASTVAYWGLGVLVVLGLISIPEEIARHLPPFLGTLLRLCAIVAFAVGLIGTVSGGSLKAFRDGMRHRLIARGRRRWLADAVESAASTAPQIKDADDQGPEGL